MEGCVGFQSTIFLSRITCRGLYGTVVKSTISGARHQGGIEFSSIS